MSNRYHFHATRRQNGAGRTLTLDAAAKRELVNVLYGDYATSEGRTPLTNCLARLAVSLAQVFTNERKKLSFPALLVPLPEQPAGDEQ